MGRVFAINLLLILAPFIIYAVYIMVDKNPETRTELWSYLPQKTLFIIGIALLGLFYVTQISFFSSPDGVYHPASVGKDGKIIPGHITPFDYPPKEKTQSE